MLSHVHEQAASSLKEELKQLQQATNDLHSLDQGSMDQEVPYTRAC